MFSALLNFQFTAMLSVNAFNLDQSKILSFGKGLTLFQSQLSTTLEKKPFENIVGKGENAGNQHFLLFPQFSIHLKKNSCFQVTFILSSANAFSLVQSKILSYGN